MAPLLRSLRPPDPAEGTNVSKRKQPIGVESARPTGAHRSHTTSHDALLAAVRTVLRGKTKSELPAHGIDVVFDDGIVAVCRSCRISWGVSRPHLANLAWWSCPRGCEPRPNA